MVRHQPVRSPSPCVLVWSGVFLTHLIHSVRTPCLTSQPARPQLLHRLPCFHMAEVRSQPGQPAAFLSRKDPAPPPGQGQRDGCGRSPASPKRSLVRCRVASPSVFPPPQYQNTPVSEWCGLHPTAPAFMPSEGISPIPAAVCHRLAVLTSEEFRTRLKGKEVRRSTACCPRADGWDKCHFAVPVCHSIFIATFECHLSCHFVATFCIAISFQCQFVASFFLVSFWIATL